MKSKETLNTKIFLTEEEKILLKKEIQNVWSKFPIEMKKFIFETKKQKLQSLYMIESWAKENNHKAILDLIGKRIAHKEKKIEKLKKELGA